MKMKFSQEKKNLKIPIYSKPVKSFAIEGLTLTTA